MKSMPGVTQQNVLTASDIDAFEALITNETLKNKVEKLFRDGHHSRAVEEAYKYLDNFVKKASGIEESGAKLMQAAFSFNNPILMLNAGSNTSEQDEQKGYLQIFAGCMTGIRNPRAHESDWEDSEIHALQLLVFANHLVERVTNAKHITRKTPSEN